MTFATATDLQARFGDRELRLVADRDDGAVYADVLAAALQDADAEIVGLIGSAVVIDAENPPLNLKRLACDIARYRLYGSNPTEDVRLRYVDAVKFLRLVAAGDATLDGGAIAPTVAAAAPLAAASEPGNRVFKRGLG
jgi:phage gp36-like protein